MQFIKKRFNTRINEARGIIIFHEDSLQLINYQIKCYLNLIKLNCKSQQMLKFLSSNVSKSPLFWYIGMKLS